MANSRANVSLAGATSGTPVVLFDRAAGDIPCSTYAIRNRDASLFVRVIVSGCHSSGEDGAVIGPGDVIPFHGNITKVVAWPESGSPSVDGFVQSRV